MNVIGDIAGSYDEFMFLLKKMPDEEVISIGDMIDRGPKSKEVLEWFMKNGKAILGNHEHMMIDNLEYNSLYYENGIWQSNGGRATLESYGYMVPEDVLRWLKSLPKYMIIDGILISHAFIDPIYDTIEQACELGLDSMRLTCDRSIIWNRSGPIRRPQYKMQICGHNSQFGLKTFSDKKGDFAVCIDDSRQNKLTGIHIPSMKIYQQDYII